MSLPYCVFVVDDDPLVQSALSSILKNEYEVETFASSEACRARLEEKLPDLLLLDISLPGMDGYEFCRQLKGDSNTEKIPITFVSSNDSIEDRLTGYEAGASDFIVKPFDVTEVLQKVHVAKLTLEEKHGLAEQVQASEQLTSMVLESMDEFGLVLQFLGKVIACANGSEVAEAMLHLLKGYRLEGAVQVRVGDEETTLSQDGPSSPLEVSIVNHVRTLERLFEFGKKSVHNFDHITILVGNTPVDNPDLCGRIRDNLSMAAQGADARLHAIQTEEANQRKQAGIIRVLEHVRATIKTLSATHQRERAQGSAITIELQEDLVNSFVHLGLTTGQEHFLEDLVRRHMERLIGMYDSGDQSQDAFELLSRELESLTST